MNDIRDKIKRRHGGVMGIYGVANRLLKSEVNVIVHVPVPLFVEYFWSDLQRETTTNIVDNMEDVIPHLIQLIGMNKIYSFVSHS